jgi:hypothetical protein
MSHTVQRQCQRGLLRVNHKPSSLKKKRLSTQSTASVFGVCLSVCLFVYLSIYLSIYLSTYLSIYLSIYLSGRPSVCLSMCEDRKISLKWHEPVTEILC